MLDVTLGGAILAGILSFLSPCILPLVPPYLCFVSGASLQDLTDGRRTNALPPAIAFVLGFATVFVLLGASASLLGQLLTDYLRPLTIISGLLIFGLGLNFMGLLPLSFIKSEIRFHPSTRPLGLLGAYVVGLAFAFGWTPCVGPILTAILLVAGAQDTWLKGTVLLAAYATGIGIPFILAAVFVGPFLRWLQSFRRYLGWVERLGGAFLVITGLLFLTDTMPAISYWLLERFPSLGTHG